MKLRYLRNLLNKALRFAGNTKPKVRFYIDDKEYYIKRIGQFGVMPDVTIELVVRND